MGILKGLILKKAIGCCELRLGGGHKTNDKGF